ncbi:MAG: hypothetical protein IJ306_10455 [Oscillospiraceae bacterium]|nr:hypothetical protein [Oscillospiraceae bacterium]
MRIGENIKKNIAAAIGVIAGIIVLVLFIFDDFEHIEDTNGPDDYSLTTITDENIINLDMGSLGGPRKHKELFSNTTYSAEKFSGVCEIYGENIVANRMEFYVNHAEVNAGNFRIVIVVDDEIVHDFTLNELTQSYVLEDVSGYVALRIAGESADFEFDYDVI